MGSSEHQAGLWYANQKIAQVVKYKGKPGRYDPLVEKYGQGEHRCAVITDDMPQNVMTPTRCHTGSDTFAGYGKYDNYKNLDGTRFCVEFLGPNRDCRMKWSLPTHGGPDPGKPGQPGLVPTASNRGK